MPKKRNHNCRLLDEENNEIIRYEEADRHIYQVIIRESAG